MLSSQFQRFCRDLHSEAVDHLGRAIAVQRLHDLFRSQLMENRKLDTGNPNPANIGSDFARLDMDFWPVVVAADALNAARREALEMLNRWGNAIAHQDFGRKELGGRSELRLSEVRRWRTVCDALAGQFDPVVARHVATITGAPAWWELLPMPSKTPPSARRRNLRVGDRVILDLGYRRKLGEAVEDRGFIGVGGRQLVRVRWEAESPEAVRVYEVPAEELERVR